MKPIAKQLTLTLLWTAMLGTSQAQDLDVCGCRDSLDSLGDFRSDDAATWPPGTSHSGCDINIPLPEEGVLIFDSFTLQNGTPSCSYARVYFKNNAANDPVTLLIKGDLTVFGNTNNWISVEGKSGASGNSGSGGQGGLGGPGGFRGGDGAHQFTNCDLALEPDGCSGRGGDGLGPGGGAGSSNTSYGGHGTFVGTASLLPLLGGSGGGGGGSTTTGLSCAGGGGGGGGGAILIAANGTITVDGSIRATGGSHGSYGNWQCSGYGGHGAGGAIRLVAPTINGSGYLYANSSGGDAYDGSIRLESFNLGFTVTRTDPPPTRGFAPGALRNPFEPSLIITQVAGTTPPDPPQGYAGVVDVIVPAPGPVTVEVASQGIPGNTLVDLEFKPRVGEDFASGQILLSQGSCSSGEFCGSTTVDVPAAGTYTLEARATFQTLGQ